LFKSGHPKVLTPDHDASPNSGGNMSTNEGRNLAESMIRMYGPAKAADLVDRYAAESTASGDVAGHARWAAAALVIGETMERTAQPKPAS
jgi:hypothetical protein